MARVLLATAEPVLPASALSDSGDTALVDVLTGQASLDALLATGAKFTSAVVACGPGRASLAPAFLGGIAKALQPGGRVTLQLGPGAAAVRAARACARVRAPARAAPPRMESAPPRRAPPRDRAAAPAPRRPTPAARCCSAASSARRPRPAAAP